MASAVLPVPCVFAPCRGFAVLFVVGLSMSPGSSVFGGDPGFTLQLRTADKKLVVREDQVLIVCRVSSTCHRPFPWVALVDNHFQIQIFY